VSPENSTASDPQHEQTQSGEQVSSSFGFDDWLVDTFETHL
jgi:hypothetical protein